MSINNIYTTQFTSRNDNILNDYLTYLCEKISKTHIYTSKKLEKLEKLEKNDNDLDHVPKYNEYNLLLKINYNVQQLKLFAKTYKLKITGNKQQLVSRIYSHLYLSNQLIKIQKLIRGCLTRKYNNIHGPAFKNRLLCTNTFDFLSMDKLTSIQNEQFFSFKDKDGFIYGFDILSLYNLIYKCNGIVKNPFNQQPLTSTVIENLKTLLRLSKILKINISTEILDVTKVVSNKKSVELRTLTLFQNIDALGNYSNPQWFLILNKNKLIKFLRELIDIFHFRANLAIEIKRAICPPTGNPFTMANFHILQNLENLDDIRKIILEILEKMVNTGIDKDYKCLGAYYILGAITLVNNEAATSLPWLYESSYHM
jgi:hypothetical protein